MIHKYFSKREPTDFCVSSLPLRTALAELVLSTITITAVHCYNERLLRPRPCAKSLSLTCSSNPHLGSGYSYHLHLQMTKLRQRKHELGQDQVQLEVGEPRFNPGSLLLTATLSSCGCHLRPRLVESKPYHSPPYLTTISGSLFTWLKTL